MRRGDLQAALQYSEDGVRSFREQRNSTWPLTFHLIKAEILLTQERTADARNLLDNLPASIPRSDGLEARLLMDLGQLRMASGQPREALALFNQAGKLASQAGATSLQVWIELKRGWLLDNFDESDATFHRALDIATSQHDEFFQAMALNNLGRLRMLRFRYDEAIPWLESANRTAQKVASKVTVEKALGNLGWCDFRLGRWERALDLFTRAEAIAAEQHMAGDQHRWLGNIGSIYYVRENYGKAISYYSQALDIAQGLGNAAEAATWLTNIARAYIDQSKWVEAEKFNRLALDAEDRAPNADALPYTQLNAGLIGTARGRTNEAETAFNGALQLARKSRQPNVEWQAHSGLAELYRLKKRPQAKDEYAAAVGVLDREWLALSREDSKITFRSYQTSFYQDYIGFLSQQGQKEKALEVAESSRARLLMQKLDGRSSALPEFRVADAVRLARESGAVLLSYWLAPNRSYLWAVTAKGVSQFVLPGESAINAVIEQHRRSIEDLRDPLASGDASARQLYRTLLGPVEPMLHATAPVIISPDGHLHEINFETLVVDGPKPHYWIDDSTVALVPSLGVLQRAPTHRSARRPRLLMIGDPLPADPEFPPLPHLKTEITEIAAGFAESDRAVYTGAEAYAERFREAAPQTFSAVHFAAHAAANEESPLNSAIILSPHGNKYKLYASEVAGLHLDPELVTISACRSAGSKAYSGEGLIGFAWAFLDAGAHNVVAGIWNVDDAAAPLLMKEFYKEWREGGDPAAALRGAKRELMRAGGAFRKPYYWGAFEVFTRQANRSAMAFAWRKSSK
jgi:CHAT domain-containing protein/Tfp pilus assembly protein PilF